MTPEEFKERRSYCVNPNIYCHAGGYYNYLAIGLKTELHDNYGYPCTRGAVYAEDGTLFAYTTSCIFCGKEFVRATSSS